MFWVMLQLRTWFLLFFLGENEKKWVNDKDIAGTLWGQKVVNTVMESNAASKQMRQRGFLEYRRSKKEWFVFICFSRQLSQKSKVKEVKPDTTSLLSDQVHLQESFLEGWHMDCRSLTKNHSRTYMVQLYNSETNFRWYFWSYILVLTGSWARNHHLSNEVTLSWATCWHVKNECR